MKNFTKKFEKALSLAEEGDIESQIYIADAFEEGKIIESNKSKAFYWYKKASEQGDEYAEVCVALKLWITISSLNCLYVNCSPAGINSPRSFTDSVKSRVLSESVMIHDVPYV